MLSMAQEAGHTVKECHPSLVPFETVEMVQRITGLILKNVNMTMYDGKRKYIKVWGMLFTHFGVSGPLVLSASSFTVM